MGVTWVRITWCRNLNMSLPVHTQTLICVQCTLKPVSLNNSGRLASEEDCSCAKVHACAVQSTAQREGMCSAFKAPLGRDRPPSVLWDCTSDWVWREPLNLARVASGASASVARSSCTTLVTPLIRSNICKQKKTSSTFQPFLLFTKLQSLTRQISGGYLNLLLWQKPLHWSNTHIGLCSQMPRTISRGKEEKPIQWDKDSIFFCSGNVMVLVT